MAERVAIGRILKVHGVRGEVIFAPAGEESEILRAGLAVYFGAGGDASLVVTAARRAERNWIVAFSDVETRDDAEALAGRSLFVEAGALPKLPEGEFYQYQLVDLQVTGADGRALGRVVRVLDLPGQDLLEIRGPEGEILVPIRREFVEWIDLERGEIRLADRADLLEAQRRRVAPEAGPRSQRGPGSQRDPGSQQSPGSTDTR